MTIYEQVQHANTVTNPTITNSVYFTFTVYYWLSLVSISLIRAMKLPSMLIELVVLFSWALLVTFPCINKSYCWANCLGDSLFSLTDKSLAFTVSGWLFSVNTLGIWWLSWVSSSLLFNLMELAVHAIASMKRDRRTILVVTKSMLYSG